MRPSTSNHRAAIAVCAGHAVDVRRVSVDLGGRGLSVVTESTTRSFAVFVALHGIEWLQPIQPIDWLHERVWAT